MSTYNQCESCLKPINSLTDPLCWECQSTVDNANSAGGLNLGNISPPEHTPGPSQSCDHLARPYDVSIRNSRLHSDGIDSATGVQHHIDLSGRTSVRLRLPSHPVHRPARPCVHISVDDPQDAAIRPWKRTKRTRIHTRILLTRADNRTRAHIHGSTTLLA